MKARPKMPTRWSMAFALIASAVLFSVVMPGVALATTGIPADTVTGAVYDMNADPVVGAQVQLEPGNASGQLAITDAAGEYQFVGLDPDDYNLWVSAPGLMDGFDSFTLDGISGYDSVITLLPPQITGTVTSGGDGVQGAPVRLFYRATPGEEWGQVDTGYTDSLGKYRFGGFDDGEYAVGYPGTATEEGEFFAPQYFDGVGALEDATPVDVVLGTTQSDIDLALSAAVPSIIGTVRNGSGVGLADVTIRVFEESSPGSWESFAGTSTASDGSYVLYGLGSGTFRVGTDAYVDGVKKWAPAFHTATGPSATTAAAGLDVITTDLGTASGVNIVLGTPEILAKDAYEADDIAAQAKAISTDGGVKNHTLSPAPDDDWTSFQAIAGHTYTIETSGSAAFPLWSDDTDTWLELYDSNAASLIAYDDDRGGGLFSKVIWTAPTTKTVYVRVTDYSSANASPSQMGAYSISVIDGAVAGGGTISGDITDSVTGQGVGGIRVRAQGSGGTWRVYTDSTGHYSIDGLPLGAYFVEPDAGSYEPTDSVGVTLVNEGDHEIQDFVLVPLATPASAELNGYVMSGGSVVTSVTVTVVRTGSTETSTTQSDEEGYYAFDGLPAGTYSVVFSKAGYDSSTYEGVVLVAGDTASRSGALVAHGALSGIATIPGGAPLAGVSVAVDGPVRAITLADGSYSVPDLAAGVHSVTFSAAGYQPYSQGFVVSPGETTTISPTLSAVPVVVTTPMVSRSPSKSTLNYKRKRGKARYKLSATVSDVSGARLTGRLVYLQTSKNGKTGWKNSYRLMTDSSGTAGKTFTIRKRSTAYYRWVVTPTSTHNQVILGRQKIMVK